MTGSTLISIEMKGRYPANLIEGYLLLNQLSSGDDVLCNLINLFKIYLKLRFRSAVNESINKFKTIKLIGKLSLSAISLSSSSS